MTTTKERALVTKANAPLQALAAQINAAHDDTCRAAQSAIA